MKGEGSTLKDLQPFFNPKSVLIVGVSRQALSFSFTVLKNLLEIFYQGRLYILNPNANDILGVKSYHSFEELPEIPELAVIVLGKDILDIVEKIRKQVNENIRKFERGELKVLGGRTPRESLDHAIRIIVRNGLNDVQKVLEKHINDNYTLAPLFTIARV